MRSLICIPNCVTLDESLTLSGFNFMRKTQGEEIGVLSYPESSPSPLDLPPIPFIPSRTSAWRDPCYPQAWPLRE